MNKDLTVALYGAINDRDQDRVIDHWHCSSIAKCPRALYFERKLVPALKANEPGGGKKLRWRAGHAIEATIRPELEKIYPHLLTNVRFTNEELDLTGEFDAYDPASKTLISVKSVHDFAFKTINGVTGLKEDTGEKNARGNIVWKLKKEPYLHHQWQEHAYVLLLRSGANTTILEGAVRSSKATVAGFYEIENITYVYVTLGGLICCFTTDVSDFILKRVSAKVQYLNDAWEASTPPICLCHDEAEMYRVQDQYCPYKTEGGDCCSISLLDQIKETV